MTMTRRQTGFSLIEILIALFVFAIGILTVAGLQIVSKRTNHEAVQRTSATYLAYDIIERMRANADQLDIYVDTTLGAMRPPPATMCNASSCSQQQLAAFDVWEWQQAIQGVAEQNNGVSTGGLVNPTGCIAGPAAGGQGIYTITIAWQGVESLTNNFTDNLCGQGNAGYGTNLEYRRLIETVTYIAP